MHLGAQTHLKRLDLSLRQEEDYWYYLGHYSAALFIQDGAVNPSLPQRSPMISYPWGQNDVG